MNEKKSRLLRFGSVIFSLILVTGLFVFKQEKINLLWSFIGKSEQIIIENPREINEITASFPTDDKEKIDEDLRKLSIENEEQQEEQSLIILPEKDIPKIAAVETENQFLTSPVKHKGDYLRIAFITDIHAQSDFLDGKFKIRSIFVDRINYFLRQTNDKLGSDIIIINGDVIEGTKIPSSQGQEEINQIKKLLDQTSIKKYWVIGNHDLRSVEKQQWKQILNIDYTYKSFKTKGCKVLILDSNFDADGRSVSPGSSYTRGNISEKEMGWLKKELSSKEKKIIFMHHPPLRGINSVPDINLLKNTNELRALFSENNVLAVFAGHIEDLYFEEYNGVKYFVFPGIYKNSKYQGAFASIDIEKSKIKAEMSYIGKNGDYKTMEIED